MNLNEYQAKAESTAIYPMAHRGVPMSLSYAGLKLNGEAGEVAEKIGKRLRDGLDIQNGEWNTALAKELGDVLWYVANLAREIGFDLEEVAKLNLDKLQSRKSRGKLGGSGDDR